MIAFLNVIGVVTLVVGAVLWFAMLKNGLSNMGERRQPAPESPPSEAPSATKTPRSAEGRTDKGGG